MANQNDKTAFEKELMRQIQRETKGMNQQEKDEYIRNMFVKKKTKTAKKMTAAKGGVAKKKMARGGAAAKKKMMKGGYAKKK